MFRSNADGCQMRGAVLIYKHENETNHLARRRDDPVTQISRFAKQVIERVLSIVLAVAEATYVQPKHLAEIFVGQRMDLVLGQRSRNNDLAFARFEWDKKFSNRLQNSHRFYSTNMQSP